MKQLFSFFSSENGLFEAFGAFAEQHGVAVDFKAGGAFDVILNYRCGARVKVIHLAAIGAFHMQMPLAFFIAYILVNKRAAVALNGAVNKPVRNKLCHQPVSRASA